MRQDRFRGGQQAEYIGVELSLDILPGESLEWAVGSIAGIVLEHIDSTEFFF